MEGVLRNCNSAKNSFEETIFGSHKIKEQHEAMKLQNEFHLKP